MKAACTFETQVKYLTRHATYVQRNIKARSRTHFCRRKAISITYNPQLHSVTGLS